MKAAPVYPYSIVAIPKVYNILLYICHDMSPVHVIHNHHEIIEEMVTVPQYPGIRGRSDNLDLWYGKPDH